MSVDARDWSTLERLRRAFLEGTAGERDYWQRPADLAAYDATFAQRIGWKWDFVLEDLGRLGWVPPAGPLLDWGCGSGIAARAFLDHFPSPDVSPVHYFDRSALAMHYAVHRARERFHDRTITAGAVDSPAVLLLSHVLTELAPPQVEALLTHVATATSVIWVEPGTYDASLALIAIRERLRTAFHPVAPCPHAGACGILAPGNEPHWCHHFASPPPGVFTDPFWARFAKLLEIDLRSLPLSYLVLDRRPTPTPAPDTARLLGRPRVNKVDLRVIACTPHSVAEVRLPRRNFPDLWHAAKKDRLPSLHTGGHPNSIPPLPLPESPNPSRLPPSND